VERGGLALRRAQLDLVLAGDAVADFGEPFAGDDRPDLGQAERHVLQGKKTVLVGLSGHRAREGEGAVAGVGLDDGVRDRVTVRITQHAAHGGGVVHQDPAELSVAHPRSADTPAPRPRTPAAAAPPTGSGAPRSPDAGDAPARAGPSSAGGATHRSPRSLLRAR